MAKKFPIGQSFQRLTNEPLDKTAVFDTLAQAQDYASNNPTAYKGQIIYVRDARMNYEISNNTEAYGKSCYISLNKEVKPICSLSDRTLDVLYDIIEDILNKTTGNTKDKLDYFHELTTNKEPSIEYPDYSFPGESDGPNDSDDPDNPDSPDIPEEEEPKDYKEEPWNPIAYTDKQICLKMSEPIGGERIGHDARYMTIENGIYEIEDISVRYRGEDCHYKIITFEQLPTKIEFRQGHLIQEIIHMCDTSTITSFDHMFYYCSSLTSLDFSNWNTSNVRDMNYMFYRCKALTQINFGNWDTSNVTNMDSMFSNCEMLKELNCANWNTSNVTNMGCMFFQCYEIAKLDCSNWDVSKVKDFGSMFRSLNNLVELSLVGWIISPSHDTTQNIFYLTKLIELTNIDMSRCDQYTRDLIVRKFNDRDTFEPYD